MTWLAVRAAFASAWAWLKKYWHWLLFPIGILLFVLGRLGAKKAPIVVVDSELAGHQKVVEQANADAQRAQQEAAKNASTELGGIAAHHASEVDEVGRQQTAEVEAARGDLDKTNDLLKQLGKDMRK